MMDACTNILNFDRAELEAELVEAIAVEPYRARQLIPWLYRKRTSDFSIMTDMARDVRDLLSAKYIVKRPVIGEVKVSLDGTRKFLIELEDGKKVESVLIRQPERYTLCVSSQ